MGSSRRRIAAGPGAAVAVAARHVRGALLLAGCGIVAALDCLDLRGSEGTQWTDSGGDGCGTYLENSWCTNDCIDGLGWNPNWGSFHHFAIDGHDACDACCDCGGGVRPTPAPTPAPTPGSTASDDEEDRASVVVTLLVEGVDYDKLQANATMRSLFVAEVRSAVAAVAHVPEGTVEDVEVSRGSVVLAARLLLLDASQRTGVLADLNESSAQTVLEDRVLNEVASLPDVERITDGALAVHLSSVVAPEPQQASSPSAPSPKKAPPTSAPVTAGAAAPTPAPTPALRPPPPPSGTPSPPASSELGGQPTPAAVDNDNQTELSNLTWSTTTVEPPPSPAGGNEHPPSPSYDHLEGPDSDFASPSSPAVWLRWSGGVAVLAWLQFLVAE